MLIVRGLYKKYGTQKVVSDVSFQIGKDEIVGFLGVNGAGKSTTMKMIAGVIDPDGGEVEVCSVNRIISVVQAKRLIGYLAENNPLYSDMYVREYLRFVARVFDVKDVELQIEGVVDRVGLSGEAHKKIKELSKGYKQRVGLAQALIHDPQVLILDEPTTGLDPNQILEMRSLIKQEAKGKVVLISSHILQEVEAVCSRVIILNKGGIVADLSIEELHRVTNNKYVLEVEFAHSFSVEALSSLAGVDHCDVFSEGRLFRLSVSEDIRDVIFECSMRTGNSINNLTFKPSSLENVFTQFTK